MYLEQQAWQEYYNEIKKFNLDGVQNIERVILDINIGGKVAMKYRLFKKLCDVEDKNINEVLYACLKIGMADYFGKLQNSMRRKACKV